MDSTTKNDSGLCSKVLIVLLVILAVFSPCFLAKIVRCFFGKKSLSAFVGISIIMAMIQFIGYEIGFSYFSFQSSITKKGSPAIGLSECRFYEIAARIFRLVCYILVVFVAVKSNIGTYDNDHRYKAVLLLYTSICLFSCIRQSLFRLTFRKLPNVVLALSVALMFFVFAGISNPRNNCLWGIVNASLYAKTINSIVPALKGSLIFAAVSPAIIVLIKDIYEKYRAEFASDPKKTTRRKLLTHWRFSPRLPLSGDYLVLLIAAFLVSYLIAAGVSLMVASPRMENKETLSSTEKPQILLGINVFFLENHDDANDSGHIDDSMDSIVTNSSGFVKSPEYTGVADDIEITFSSDGLKIDSSSEEIESLLDEDLSATETDCSSESVSVLQTLGWLAVALSFSGLAAHFDISEKQLCESECFYLRYHALDFLKKRGKKNPSFLQWNDYCQVFASLFLYTSPIYSEGYVWHNAKDIFLTLCTQSKNYCGVQLLARLMYLNSSAIEGEDFDKKAHKHSNEEENKEKTDTVKQTSQESDISRAECLFSANVQYVINSPTQNGGQTLSPLAWNQQELASIQQLWQDHVNQLVEDIKTYIEQLKTESSNLRKISSGEVKETLKKLTPVYSLGERLGDRSQLEDELIKLNALDKTINELHQKIAPEEKCSENICQIDKELRTLIANTERLKGELATIDALRNAQTCIEEVTHQYKLRLDSIDVLPLLSMLQSVMFSTGLKNRLRELLSSKSVSADDFNRLIQKDVLSILCRKQTSEDCLLNWLCTSDNTCGFCRDKNGALHNRRALILEYPYLVLTCIQNRLDGIAPHSFQEYIMEYYLKLTDTETRNELVGFFSTKKDVFLESGRTLYELLRSHDRFTETLQAILPKLEKAREAALEKGKEAEEKTSSTLQEDADFIMVKSEIEEKYPNGSDEFGTADNKGKKDCSILSCYLFYGHSESEGKNEQ